MAPPVSASTSRPTWAEIDLSALRANARVLASAHGRNTPLIAVVKANAYGHGAVKVAQALLSNTETPIAMLAVASVDEGILLREAGIEAPILLLSAILPNEAAAAVEHDLTPTIGTLAVAAALDEAARQQKKTATAHWKIDTGMGRVGTWHDDASAMWCSLQEYSRLKISGIYTHFPCADEAGDNGVGEQAKLFRQAIDSCRLSREDYLLHAANSAAALTAADVHFDAIRPGIALYGASPFGLQRRAEVELKPVMNLHAKITEVRSFGRGRTASYGATWTSSRESILALVPVGYADGYPRLLSNQGEVLLRGQRCPVAGRVTMDQILVDVTDFTPSVNTGETVTLWGQDANKVLLPVEEIAERTGTIAYEVLTGVSSRVPRLYDNHCAIIN